MKLKKEHAISGLLVLAGLALLIYHYKKAKTDNSIDSAIPSAAAQPTDVSSGFQQYPSAGSASPDSHDISVGGSPLYITYNTPNTPLAGEGEEGLGQCADCGCGQGADGAALVTQLNPSGASLQLAADNLSSVFAQ